MAVSSSLQQTNSQTTGVVLVVFRDPDVPSNTSAVIERTTTSASVAYAAGWTEIGVLETCDSAGSSFVDYLPLTNDVFWYRAKHVAPGFEDSDYIFEISGSSQIISDIDFSTKPWLLDQTPLQLVMVVSSSDASQWIVYPEVNKPVLGAGTPTISLIASGNVAGISNVGTKYTVNRPSGNDALNPGYVVFESSLPGYTNGIDKVELASLSSGSALSVNSFLALNLTVTASSLVSVGVSASVSTSVAYGFGIVTSSNVGSIVQDAFGKFTITRPTSGEGSVTFIVTSSVAGIISDTDTFYVSKDPAPYLTVQAKAIGVTANALTASIDIYDSNNQLTNLTGVSLAFSTQSLAGFSGSQVGGVTQTAGKDSYTFVISRPNYNQGTGRISFNATKTGYTQDSDALDVPEKVENLARLRTVITPLASDPQFVSMSVTVIDSIPRTGSYINLSYTKLGVPTVSPASNIAISSSETRIFIATRPDFGEGTGRLNFTATGSLRNNDSDAIDIPEKSIDTTSPGAATLTIGTVVLNAYSITVPYTFASTSLAQTVEVFAFEQSGSAPSIVSVEFTGTKIIASPLRKDDGRTQFTVPITRPSNYVLLTFVPYDGLGRRGTVFTNRYQAASVALTPPDNFAAAGNTSVTATTVTNYVTMPAANLPATIRTYLNGSPYGTDIARTANASSNQSITYSNLLPSTSYTWRYSGISATGAESDLTTAFSTTTSAGAALATPDVVWNSWQSNDGGTIYFNVVNTGDYPDNTVFSGRVYDSGNTQIGTLTFVSGYTLYYSGTGGPDATYGYADVKAAATNYTDSSFSSLVQWFNTNGPIQ